MTILAFEFSSEQRSVAVARRGNVLAGAVETGGRGTNAFGMIEDVLTKAKIGREEIEVIAVGLGPGSYTGIRATIAVAQGWQLSRGIKLLGINSVECLAAQAQAGKIFGRVNVVIDAQRGEFYLAGLEISAGGWRETKPLKIVPAAEARSPATGEMIVGPDAGCFGPEGKIMFPTAAMLAKLAADRDDFVTGEMMNPVYLRETNFVKTPPGRMAADGIH